jgi:hypothetical protein
MPEGAHPLPPVKGWAGLDMVELDGKAWPLDFAAKHLGVSEEYLRVAVKEIGLQPVGTIRTAAFRRSGRQPRAYRARSLIVITEKLEELRRELGLQDPSA